MDDFFKMLKKYDATFSDFHKVNEVYGKFEFNLEDTILKKINNFFLIKNGDSKPPFFYFNSYLPAPFIIFTCQDSLFDTFRLEKR